MVGFRSTSWKHRLTALRNGWTGLPRLLRFGMIVIAAGVAGDSVAHASGPTTVEAGFTVTQQAAHLVVLLGMLIALAGVVLGGRRQGRAARASTGFGAPGVPSKEV